MKSLELVQRRCVAAGVFLALLLLRAPASGQPVNDELSADNADAKVIYDQRQSGKYNIRINIKDVAIIEIDNSGFGDENFGEEDYYYDEEDLTVKPLNFTKPPKVTTSHEALCPAESQQVTSASIQATLLPTKLEEATNTHSTPIATSAYPSNYNTNILTDTMSSQATPNQTTLKSTGTSFSRLPSLHLTQAMSEPRSHNSLISRLSTARPISESMKPSLISPIAVQESLKFSGNLPNVQKRHHNFVNKYSMLQTPRSPLYPLAKGYGQRCRAHQYRDVNGGCRNKRSSSFLKKLLSIIATFPRELVEDAPDE
ncbi:uncharacterized protein LOC105223803 [Bactrocera dorsalis]|uniref:Uncharacterized protein LOC105223803 n=1 Tax=Bactrocera dorsalis TaxID=27457 RepID=A0A6I9UWY8_BACDO|nr:uncharacterized protein LOC105223803 [Bactrocera dorsalis]